MATVRRHMNQNNISSRPCWCSECWRKEKPKVSTKVNVAHLSIRLNFDTKYVNDFRNDKTMLNCSTKKTTQKFSFAVIGSYLCCGHRDKHLFAVQQERPYDPYGDGHVPAYDFAVSAEDTLVIHPLKQTVDQRQRRDETAENGKLRIRAGVSHCRVPMPKGKKLALFVLPTTAPADMVLQQQQQNTEQFPTRGLRRLNTTLGG